MELNQCIILPTNTHKNSGSLIAPYMKYQLIVIFCFLSIIYGCAFLGSKARVYDAERLYEIKNVAIVTLAADQGIPANIDSLLDSTFTNTIRERLTQNNLFGFMFFKEVNNSNLEEVKKYDALITFRRKLNRPFGMYADSKVEISILDMKTNSKIMYVSHNTDLGNSYWINPRLPGTLIDATNGAINKLNSKLNKLNK